MDGALLNAEVGKIVSNSREITGQFNDARLYYYYVGLKNISPILPKKLVSFV